MKFLDKFKKTGKKDEYFFSLVLRQEDGIGLLMHTHPVTNSIEIVEKRLFRYSNGWEGLVNDVDELLFASETEHNIKINEIMYFVYGHLIDQHTKELKQAYAQYLKNVTKENNLKAIGYFEYNELIPAYIQHKDQIKLNAMILEVDSPAISLFLYQSGKVVFADSTAKTENFVKDVEALFNKAKEEFVLPTRVIMYDSTALEEESHQLLTHKWNSKLFIQIPKIEILTEDDINQAIIFGVKKQIFKSIANLNVMDFPDSASDESDELPEKVESNTVLKKDIDESEAVSGFVVGKDIREIDTPDSLPQDEVEIIDDYDESSFTRRQVIQREEFSDDSFEEPEIKTKTPGISFQKFFSRVSLPSQPMHAPGSMGIILGILSIVACLVAGLYATLFFFHTATLTILYQPDKINKKLTVNELPVSKQTKTFSDTATIETTGTKEVGEKAQGNVTIYNALDSEQTIPSGTKFIAEGGKTFVLDKALSVKAASQTVTSDGNILTTTSKTDTSLTAQEIGPEFNIKKDTELTIEGKSKKDLFAKSKEAFAGGSKENMQAVSETDYETVNNAVNEKLDKKADEAAHAESNLKVIKDLTSTDLDEQKYSHKIGDEADNLKLDVEAKVSFYTYKEDDIKQRLITQFTKDIDSSQTFKSENITYELSSAELSEDEKTAKVKVSAKAESTFKVDEQKLVSELKGKSRSDMRKILQGEYNAAGYELNVKAFLPFLTSVVPYFTKNISIEYRPI